MTAPATCLLSEQDLDLTDDMLNDARAKAPAGTDPVTSAIMSACSTVDTYTAGHKVLPGTMTWLAKCLAVYDIVGLLNDPTKQQQANRDEAWRVLREIRDGSLNNSSTGGGSTLTYGSKPRII